MKLRVIWMLLAASALGLAQPGAELNKSKNCSSCHAISTKVVGPAYKDVAARYAGKRNAVTDVANAIQKGCASTGTTQPGKYPICEWGPSPPMPAQPQVNDTDAVTLAKWVLSQK
jgi:cytochrome c